MKYSKNEIFKKNKLDVSDLNEIKFKDLTLKNNENICLNNLQLFINEKSFNEHKLYNENNLNNETLVFSEEYIYNFNYLYNEAKKDKYKSFLKMFVKSKVFLEFFNK